MLNEEEKQAIKIVNSLKEWVKTHFFIKDNSYARLSYNEVYILLNFITKLQKESEEKDKMINLMTKHIAKEKSDKFCEVKYLCDQNCEECIVQNFKDKVTEK